MFDLSRPPDPAPGGGGLSIKLSSPPLSLARSTVARAPRSLTTPALHDQAREILRAELGQSGTVR